MGQMGNGQFCFSWDITILSLTESTDTKNSKWNLINSHIVGMLGKHVDHLLGGFLESTMSVTEAWRTLKLHTQQRSLGVKLGAITSESASEARFTNLIYPEVTMTKIDDAITSI